MANDISIKMSGDERDLLRAFQKSNDRMEDMVKGLAKIESKSKKTEQAVSAIPKQAIDGFKRMVTGLVTVQGATALARRAYSEWREDLERLAEQSKQTSQQLIKDIVQAGDAASASRIEERINAFKGVPRDTGIAAFRGARAGAPGADLDRVLAIAERAAQGARAGEDVEKLAQTAGSLEKLAPGKSANDLVDLALSIRAGAGRDIDKLTSARALKGVGGLVATGAATPEEALGLTVSSLRADLPGTFPAQIAQLVDKQIEPKTEAGERFAAADPRERLQLILTDEQVRKAVGASPELNVGIKQLKEGEAGELAGQFQRDQQQNVLQKTIAQVGQSPAGRLLQADIAAQAGRDSLEQRGEGRAAVIAQLDKLQTDIQRSRGQFDSVIGNLGRLVDNIGVGAVNAFADVRGQGIEARVGFARERIISDSANVDPKTRSELLGRLAGIERLARSLDDDDLAAQGRRDVPIGLGADVRLPVPEIERGIITNPLAPTPASIPNNGRQAQALREAAADLRKAAQALREQGAQKVIVEVRSQEGTDASITRNSGPAAKPPETQRDARNR